MKKLRLVPLAALLIMLATFVVPAMAATIRVEPHGSYFGLPVMLESPATFCVNVTTSNEITYDPHIFLVMTETSFNSLTGNVVVSWTGGSVTILAGDWTKETDNSVKVPPGTDNGNAYTVASLRDHLQTTEPIYWAFKPFLSQPITTDCQSFTVTLPADSPRMAVYVLGKLEGSDLFNNRSPPTQPGFVVPELAPILMAVAAFSALALFALKRKKAMPLK